jgi:hypothetical protein
MFTIRWKNTGKLKEVPRLSVRFDEEEAARFEARREAAQRFRTDIDQEISREAAIVQLSEQAPIVMDPSFLEKIFTRLEPRLRGSFRLMEVVQDVQQQYNFAMTGFENSDEHPPAKMTRPTGHLKVPRLIFPKHHLMLEIAALLRNLENDPFVESISRFLQEPMTVEEFFNQLMFAFTTVVEFARNLLYQELLTLSREMTSDREQAMRDRWLKVASLRYSYALSRIVIRAMNFVLCPTVTFKVLSEADLETFDQPQDTVISLGCETVDRIYNTFDVKPACRIDPYAWMPEPLAVAYEEMDTVRDAVKEAWRVKVSAFFAEFATSISEMRASTVSIRADLDGLYDATLPSDWRRVLREGGFPSASAADVSFEHVGAVLATTGRDFAAFQLACNGLLTYSFFVVDVSKFCDDLLAKYEQIRAGIFAYLTSFTERQLVRTSERASSIWSESLEQAVDIPHWYAKHQTLLGIASAMEEVRELIRPAEIVLGFLDTVYYEPASGWSKYYWTRQMFLRISRSLLMFGLRDWFEHDAFVVLHAKQKAQLAADLDQLQKGLQDLHHRDPTTNVVVGHAELRGLQMRAKELRERCELFQKWDAWLRMPRTEYPPLVTIADNLDLLVTIWDVASALDPTAQVWCGMPYRELKVNELADVLVSWETTLKCALEKAGEAHILAPGIKHLIADVSHLILHLPILRILCNPNFRGRHWARIPKLIGFELGPNDGMTWNWLMESGIEDHILTLAAMARAADAEFQIEATLKRMVDELVNFRLKTLGADGEMHLVDPADVILMLSEHQQLMQEIFVPPHVNPFLPRIAEYDTLSQNLTAIVKQTLETQERIEELRPAIESPDLQHQEGAFVDAFHGQVEEFDNFTDNFALTLSFHQIVANEKYVELSHGIVSGFDQLKERLEVILESKRQLFPRFRLLSNVQLLKILNSSATPSATADFFSFMYPSMSVAMISEDEKSCTGFISSDGEEFRFLKPVLVTPDAIETWHNAFDAEIRDSMKTMTRTILSSESPDFLELARTIPSQILCLVLMVQFHDRLRSIFRGAENLGDDAKGEIMTNQFNELLIDIEQDIKFWTEAFRETRNVTIAGMSMTRINQRSLLERFLAEKVISDSHPLWYSTMKYSTGPEEAPFSIEVSLGPCKIEYGFEFVASSSRDRMPVIETPETHQLICSLMMGMCAGVNSCVCGGVDVNRVGIVTGFGQAIGRPIMIVPCVDHMTIESINRIIRIADLCHIHVLFKNINHLRSEVHNSLTLVLLQQRLFKGLSITIFATYSFILHSETLIPESLKIAFRPITFSQKHLDIVYRSLLLTNGCLKSGPLARKFDILTSVISKSLLPPLSTVLSLSFLSPIVRQAGLVEDFDVQNKLIARISELMPGYPVDELVTAIDAVFGAEHIPPPGENAPRPLHPTPTINAKLNSLLHAIERHTGIVLIGPVLAGKTALIQLATKHLGVQPAFVNPFAISANDLFGSESSGLLASLISESAFIVFDGDLADSWMALIGNSLTPSRRLDFGDGTTFRLTPKNHFVFETSDLTRVSPSAIGFCASVFVGDDFLSFADRLSFFIDSITSDDRIVEPLSRTLVGSLLESRKLTDIIKTFSNFFVPSLCDNFPSRQPISVHHCIFNFFTFFGAAIRCFYIPDDIHTNVAHSADDLLRVTPQIALFSLFWAFGGVLLNENRAQMDQRIRDLAAKSPFPYYFDGPIADVLFDPHSGKWKHWMDLSSADLFSTASERSALDTILDFSPGYLLVPPLTILPAVYIATTLIAQNCNVFIYGSGDVDKEILADMILHTPQVLNGYAPSIFGFSEQGTHRLLLKMVSSMIPDQNISHGWSRRKPLLSLFNFAAGPDSSASELMRYMIEHDYFYNPQTHVRSVLNGIRFIVASNEMPLNQRLLHHLFFIRVSSPTDDMLAETIDRSIALLWDIQEDYEALGDIILSMFRDLQTAYPFSLNHLLMFIQRVAMVQEGRVSDSIGEAIAYEAVRLFYDSTRSPDILTRVSSSLRQLGPRAQVPNLLEIADTRVMSNLNCPFFRPIASFEESSAITASPQRASGRRVSMARFTGSVAERLTMATVDATPTESWQRLMDLDSIAVASTLVTPRTHLVVLTELPQFGEDLITRACGLVQAEVHRKTLDEPLLKTYHDSFVSCGIHRKHGVVLVDANRLTPDEAELLPALVNSSNVFGLFERGELLRILTSIHAAGSVDADLDATLESEADYNWLVSEFVSDCQAFFHWAIVRDAPELGLLHSKAHWYIPVYGSKVAVEKRATEELSLAHFNPMIDQLRNLPLFDRFPSLVSHANVDRFLGSFGARVVAQREVLMEKLRTADEVCGIGRTMKSFLDDAAAAGAKMEAELARLDEQLAECERQTAEVNARAAAETAALEVENKLLIEESLKVERMKRESDLQLEETEAILKTATSEVQSLSSRDFAEVKAMIHPPQGIVLVVVAMCIILGQPINESLDLEAIWRSGKKIMSDVSFLTRLVTTALDGLSSAVIERLQRVTSDPNFDPAVLQRASKAAKSICTFIRSIVPYYTALWSYKAKNEGAEHLSENLTALRQRHELALAALAKSKQDVLDAQVRQGDLMANRAEMEKRLFDERDRFESLTKAGARLNPLIDQHEAKRRQVISQLERLEKECFATQVLLDFCGPFDDKERGEIFTALAGIIGTPIRREAALPTEEPLVKKWSELRFPISQFWRETTAMLSTLANRWVVVAGLRFCATTFLRTLVKRDAVTFISVKSPVFESAFVEAMRRNIGVALFDFDFGSPHLLVLLAHEAQTLRTPLNIAGESLTVPEDFMVYIDVGTLPTAAVLHMDVRMVDLQLSESVMTEVIALRLFELTNGTADDEAGRLEVELRHFTEGIEETESRLSQLLIENGVSIFDNRAKQWELLNLITESKELATKARKARQMHLWLFENFPTLKLLGKALTDFFASFPNRRKLWRLFDAEFESVRRLETETLLDSVRRRLLAVMCAELPIRVRLECLGTAFELGLDGANCVAVETPTVQTLTRARSLDLVWSDPLSDPPLQRSFSATALPPGTAPDTTAFDLFLANVSAASEDQVFAWQAVGNLLSLSNPRRPLVCHTARSAYQMAAFVRVASLTDRFMLVLPSELAGNVVAACQSGKILATACCSATDLTNAIAAVSTVFAVTAVSRDFRLVILVHEMGFEEVSEFSGVIDQCDLVVLDSPMTIKTAVSSTLSSLTKLRFDLFTAQLALFDAASGVISQNTLCAPFHPFSTFEVALLCCGNPTSARFIAEYLYEFPDDGIWTRVKAAQYPLPRSFSPASIQAARDECPRWDHPHDFGLPRKSFALFQELLMAPRADDYSCPIPDIEADDLFRTELFLLKLVRSLKTPVPFIATRLKQITAGPSVVDFSLLLAPDVFVEKVLARGVVKGGLQRPIAVLKGGEGDGVKVTGLIAQDAKWTGSGFSKALRCTSLPVLRLCAVERSEVRGMASLWHNGRPVMEIGVLGEVPQGGTVTIFPRPLS